MVPLEKIMKAELKKSVKEIQENIDLEIGILKSRLDSLEEKIQTTCSKPSDKFDPDVSIVILGLAHDEGEDLNGKVRELLESGLECEPVPEIAAVLRMRARGPGPGVVKVAFANVEDKVAVLRCKQRLKSNTQFKRVYLGSAKSHTDRILEFNFKTLLQEICWKRFLHHGERPPDETDLCRGCSGCCRPSRFPGSRWERLKRSCPVCKHR